MLVFPITFALKKESSHQGVSKSHGVPIEKLGLQFSHCSAPMSSPCRGTIIPIILDLALFSCRTLYYGKTKVDGEIALQ